MEIHHAREKFAKRRMRHRRPIPIAAATAMAVVLTAFTTIPLLAETAGGLESDRGLEFDGGQVMTMRDALTGEYDSTVIGIGTFDLHEGEVVVMHGSGSGLYAVMFRPHPASSARDAGQVTFRFDRAPPLTIDGFWLDHYFCFAIDSDMFLDFLIDADRLIYRIGDGHTLEVPIPADIAEGVAYFRSQVDLHSNRPSE